MNFEGYPSVKRLSHTGPPVGLVTERSITCFIRIKNLYQFGNHINLEIQCHRKTSFTHFSLFFLSFVHCPAFLCFCPFFCLFLFFCLSLVLLCSSCPAFSCPLLLFSVLLLFSLWCPPSSLHLSPHLPLSLLICLFFILLWHID